MSSSFQALNSDFEETLDMNKYYNSEIHETHQDILSSSDSEDIEINNGIIMFKRKNKRRRILALHRLKRIQI